jgi:hypothetical protein
MPLVMGTTVMQIMLMPWDTFDPPVDARNTTTGIAQTAKLLVSFLCFGEVHIRGVRRHFSTSGKKFFVQVYEYAKPILQIRKLFRDFIACFTHRV